MDSDTFKTELHEHTGIFLYLCRGTYFVWCCVVLLHSSGVPTACFFFTQHCTLPSCLLHLAFALPTSASTSCAGEVVIRRLSVCSTSASCDNCLEAASFPWPLCAWQNIQIQLNVTDLGCTYNRMQVDRFFLSLTKGLHFPPKWLPHSGHVDGLWRVTYT